LQAIMDVAANLTLFEMESKPGGEAGEVRTERLSRGAGSNAAAGLAGLSLFQAVRGNVLGNAVESFWLSFSAQTMLGCPGLAAVFAVAGVWQMFSGQLLGSAASLFIYSMMMRDVVVVQEARACNRRVAS
jgi:hypothetical protein